MGSIILNFYGFVTMFRTFFHEILTRNILRKFILSFISLYWFEILNFWSKSQF